ncbi:MAG: DMT family transporter [Bacteroidales bacterium]|jgi:drug/metabolite transporter (DMT)-like permease|nr:DMT family transporter [Bacteroidales bacterium]MDD2203892.1 DMT family transporter [Bacteroidales bacterium]MDD3913093.1 DMT family transporter [Bacteroidales bacterium]MDD4633008.1 DMT family transporter [Bacteroidales bacterium]
MPKQLKDRYLFVYILVVLAMIFWGSTFVWTKSVLSVYQPITIITLRLLISSVLLFAVMFFTRNWQKIQRIDYKYLLLVSFFSPFIYFLGETYGIKNSSSTVSSVIISTIPVFTAVFSTLIYKERLSKLNLLGMLISFIGVILVITNKDFSISLSVNGFLWLALAVASSVGYVIILRKISVKYKPVTIVAYQNSIGFVFFLPLFFIFDYKSFTSASPTTDAWLNIFLLAIFGSSLAFIFYTIGNRDIGVAKTGFLTNLIPIFTAITAFFLLDERLTLINIFGVLLTVFGVAISQKKSNRIAQAR